MPQAPAPSRPLSRALSLAIAWTGGFAFFGSLAYFLYFYGVRLGREAEVRPGGQTSAVLVNSALFTLFAVHHSLMARMGAKAWLTRTVPAPLERTTYVWVASLLFFAACWWWQPLDGRLYRVEGAAAALGYALQLAGIVLALWSARAVQIFDLAGINQAHGAGAHGTTRLETTGPYRLVRHPIYLGWLLLTFATPDMTLNRLLFCVLSLAYLVVGVLLEERSLRAEFGRTYEEYARAVRWRLVPGVY